MSKRNKFVKGDSVPRNSMQILLVPISIILSGVIIAVSFLIGSTAIISNMKSTIESSVAQAIQKAGLASTTPTPTPVTITTAQLESLFDGTHITFGDKNRSVIFVEFSDPSCPYCHAAAGLNGQVNIALEKERNIPFTLVSDGGTFVAPVPEMKKLVDQNKAAFVWAYDYGHAPSGALGAQALYCAYDAEKFWPVHDKLMSAAGYDFLNTTLNTNTTDTAAMSNFLKDVVDQNTMKSCLDSGKYKDKPAEDRQLASSFGSVGTPGFFINTTNFGGAISFKEMESVVTAALQ